MESEDPLPVALPEELFAGAVGPQPGDVPGTARVGDVGALDGDLKDEVAVLFLGHVQLTGLLVALQQGQELGLTGNVRGQDQVLDNLLQNEH